MSHQNTTKTPNRALLAEASSEYARTVAAASNPKMPVDGRRVLTSEHMALKSAMDSYRRGLDGANLRAVIDECARTRGLWT